MVVARAMCLVIVWKSTVLYIHVIWVDYFTSTVAAAFFSP